MTYISKSMQASRQRGVKKWLKTKKAEFIEAIKEHKATNLRHKKPKFERTLSQQGKVPPKNYRALKQRKIAFGRTEIQTLSKSKVKKDLNIIFSAYIRMRDADNEGIVICISSGKRYHWHNVDNGHYLPRSTAPALIFNEMNCNAQSKIDNWLEGNRLEYRKGMIKKYGLDKVEMLETMQYKKSGIGLFEMKILLLEYIQKFQEQCKRLNHIPNTTQQRVLNRWSV